MMKFIIAIAIALLAAPAFAEQSPNADQGFNGSPALSGGGGSEWSAFLHTSSGIFLVGGNNVGGSTIPSLNGHNSCGLGQCTAPISARPKGCAGACLSVESRKNAAKREYKATHGNGAGM